MTNINDMAYKKNYAGLKFLVMIVSFILTIYFSFSGANHVIHWIASGIENHDIHLFALIVLWLFSLGFVIGVSFGLASLVVGILASIFDI